MPKKTTSNSQLAYIREPLHNLREMTKQLLCLEDHFASKDRRCHDCIRKHLLYAEALAEEGAAMDMTGKYRKYLGQLGRSLRNMEAAYFLRADDDAKANKKKKGNNNSSASDPHNIQQALRQNRKYIVDNYAKEWTKMYTDGRKTDSSSSSSTTTSSTPSSITTAGTAVSSRSYYTTTTTNNNSSTATVSTAYADDDDDYDSDSSSVSTTTTITPPPPRSRPRRRRPRRY